MYVYNADFQSLSGKTVSVGGGGKAVILCKVVDLNNMASHVGDIQVTVWCK